MLEFTYYSVPLGVWLSYQQVTEYAGRRLPYTTGEYDQPPTDFYRPDYFEFKLVTAGEGRRWFEGPDGTPHSHPMTPGQLYFFRPRDYFAIRGVDGPRSYRPLKASASGGRTGLHVICVTFPVETWERFAIAAEIDQRPFLTTTPPMLEVDLDDPDVMRPFRRILEQWQRRLRTVDVIRFLTTTAPWFEDAAHADDPTGVPPWLRTAVAAMQEEDNLRAGVPRLTELAHVSHGHLWRTTRSHFGVSPSDLVGDIRLHHASLLLSATDTPIAAIAARCGYSSPAYFSTAFRRSRLMSPRDYRARSRERS
jgi:AraC-like DNA-binding protein